MTRNLFRLKTTALPTLIKTVGRHHDGGGLYLDVTSPTAASWVYRYQLNGKVGNLGLGPYPAISLARGREKAAEARRLKAEGIDPLDHRRASRAAPEADKAKRITFEEATDRYIKAKEPGWKNGASGEQWRASLRDYAHPIIGKVPVATIDTPLVMRVLEPVWTTIPETASRIRNRIESILEWARAAGYRSGDNPARWRGHLEHMLAPRSKVQRREHYPALPYGDLPAFMAALCGRNSTAARALQFLILTAARSEEVRCAPWSEIDLADRVWTVPGLRMKNGREHRVPLSDAAIALLGQRQDGLIFPGLGKNILTQTTKHFAPTASAHGFRATFRTWASDKTMHQDNVVEAALAHAIGNETQQAYQRGTLFEKRRQLMADWATYCVKALAKDNNVVTLPVAAVVTSPR
jgi:integrase